MADETIVPAFTLRDRVPAAHVALAGPSMRLAHYVRVSLERAINGASNQSIWRPEFLLNHFQLPQASTMPPPNAASTEARTRRSASAEHRARFATRQEALRLHGAEIAVQTIGSSWVVLLVRKPGDERTHIYAQVPSASAALMNKLWESGLRIDGFDYDAYDSSLHTVVRTTDQMPLVDQLVVWLSGYLAGALHVGDGPPAPYTLVPAPSLVERISAFDSAASL